MNKAQLIEKIAEDTKLSKVDVSRMLSSFIKVSSETLSQQDKLVMSGFGTFSVTNMQGRVGRNPRTGEKIDIPARKVAKFKPSAELNNLIE